MEKLARISVSGALEGEYVVLSHRRGNVLKIAPLPPDGLPVVTSLKKTCIACPSQWEGTLDDGRVLYVRFRWGELTAGLGERLEDAVKNSRSEDTLLLEHVGDGLDGFMKSEEMRGHLHGLLEFPEELVVEDDDDWGSTFGPIEPAEGESTAPDQPSPEAEGVERVEPATPADAPSESEPPATPPERIGSHIAEEDIRYWTCFSCGGKLTQAHHGDYFHTDSDSTCNDTIPVPTSLVEGTSP